MSEVVLAIPVGWKWTWVVACLIASLGAALGAVFVIRAGYFVAAIPCFLLSGSFGFWAWWEVRQMRLKS